MPKSKISLIVAMTPTGVIGDKNQLLWHLPNDLKHFKALTLGKPIVMGRKTYESIGRPLPGRQNIVLTRQSDVNIPGCDVVRSAAEAVRIAEGDELMVIGGREIYQLFFPLATHLYITWVAANLSGETVFPKWHQTDWEIQSEASHPADPQHAYAYSFISYQRRS